MQPISVFLACAPGLEPLLLDEARAIGISGPRQVPGGVECQGGWEAVRRANLRSRIASRVLARIARFEARGYPALVAGFREVEWGTVLPARAPVRIEASVSKSRASHGGAVARHLTEALTRAGHGTDAEADLRIMARVDRDVCTISLDTSGEPLHRRGHKRRVNRAPLRETLAAGLLCAAGYRGEGPVLDPMCGSGTIPIEAAEIAAGLRPGRDRAFAFEALPSHDPDRWAALKADAPVVLGQGPFRGSDRDAGAVAMARANAKAAGVEIEFEESSVSDVAPPDGPAGLLIANPPYGKRIGDRRLAPLYGTFGKVARARFTGWRVALLTTDRALAEACDLPWGAPGPVIDHGGIKVRLWQACL